MKSTAVRNHNKVYRDMIMAALVILFVLVLTVTGLIGPFDPFELRVYDFLMQAKKDAPERDDLVIVAIDDYSIGELGTFPWSRDIVADGIIRMRELGAASVTFDIEYLSQSKKGIDPDVERKLTAKFNVLEQNVGSYFGDIADVVSSGLYTEDEINGIVWDICDYLTGVEFRELYDSVSSDMTRDMDGYFADALAFFGNSWLTLNVEDMGIKVTDEQKEFMNRYILLDKVIDEYELTHPECEAYIEDLRGRRGLTPALLMFMENSAGSGFTNIVLDSDGTRRRVKLLFDEGDKFAAQLVMAPMLNILKPASIERTRQSLILHDILMPGEEKPRDMVIPLDGNGNMLINWINSSFNDSFKYESFIFLNQLDSFEKELVGILRTLAAQTQFAYDAVTELGFVSLSKYLVDEYDRLTEVKEELLRTADASSSRNDPRFEEYFSERKQFFEDCACINDPELAEDIEGFLFEYADDDVHQAFSEFFGKLFGQFSLYLDFYNEEFQRLHEDYDGAFCIIGHTAAASTDLGNTPFENHYPNVGTHANVYNTIMSEAFITPVPWYYGFIISSLLLFLIIFVTHGTGMVIQNVLGIAGIFIVIAACVIPMVAFDVYVPVLSPALIMIIGYVISMIYRFMYAEREKRFLKSTLSTYVSKDIVNEIVDDPSKLKLGGDEKNITAIFTDIRSFSTISEKITPTELVSFLNRYLTLLSDIILENGGTIDKYEGDAIIAFVGAPVSYQDHAWRACVSAVNMKKAEQRFNDELAASGIIPDKICMPICTRIGINTGNMVVGNMGTENKMNYTMMGNAVNIASRLEGVNKYYKSWILVSETTWNAADSGAHRGELVARRFDRVRVVGIDEPVQLYNILGFRAELSDAVLESVDIFHEGLSLYLAKDFDNARKLFERVLELNPDDESAAVFVKRCYVCSERGVPENWDGVMNLNSK